MVALAASDVTITIPSSYAMSYGTDGLKTVSGTITYGNGVLTYPTGGVPLPAIGAFGMRVTMQSLVVFGNRAYNEEFQKTYNPITHKLVLYEEEAPAATGPLPEADAAEAPVARTYDFIATGW